MLITPLQISSHPRGSSIRRRIVTKGVLCAALGCLVLCLAGSLFADRRQVDEYKLKAAFLYNFAKFVEWPRETFKNKKAPIVIGVLGKDDFEGALKQTIGDKKVKGRTIVTKKYKTVGEVRTCHVLFVSKSEQKNLVRILHAIKNRSLLTTSDMKDFAIRGGMIGIVPRGKKLSLEFNLQAARKARLKLSNFLLKVGKVIKR